MTVGRFRRFVEAGQGTQQQPPPGGAGERPTLAGSGWQASWNSELHVDRAALLADLNCEPGLRQTWADVPGATENHPINCIDWYTAFAFCAWDGGWLPTEAEWNFAAAGGDEQRAFPFSSPPGSLTTDCATVTQGGCPGDTTVAGVASGYGRFEHADLAGNVWEWVLDTDAPYMTPCDDCAALGPGTTAIIRGGSFFDGASTLRAANRVGTPPSGKSTAIGVRCAYPMP